MATKISYKGPMDAEPKLVGYFRESPKAAFEGLYRDHRIYKYNSILNPTDNSIENRCSGLIISEADVPSGKNLLSIHDLWFGDSLESGLSEENYFNAAIEAIENNLTVFKNGSVNYLELRDWQENEAREKAMKDIMDIVSVTLKIPNPTPRDLSFILEQ